MATQWRMGMSGMSGLDYGCLRDVMALCGIGKGEEATIFNDVRVMERIALAIVRKGD